MPPKLGARKLSRPDGWRNPAHSRCECWYKTNSAHIQHLHQRRSRSADDRYPCWVRRRKRASRRNRLGVPGPVRPGGGSAGTGRADLLALQLSGGAPCDLVNRMRGSDDVEAVVASEFSQPTPQRIRPAKGGRHDSAVTWQQRSRSAPGCCSGWSCRASGSAGIPSSSAGT
jgi:hypothetical protein